MNLMENYIMIFGAFHLCAKEEYFTSLSCVYYGTFEIADNISY